jgi:hypothetical protein
VPYACISLYVEHKLTFPSDRADNYLLFPNPFQAPSKGGYLVKVEQDVSLECLDANLKMLQLTHYSGKAWEVNLIRFFLLNARLLESMKIVVSHVVTDEKWIASQHKKLRLDTRASQGARFAFENDSWPSDLVPMKHVHNLALENPFDRSVRIV